MIMRMLGPRTAPPRRVKASMAVMIGLLTLAACAGVVQAQITTYWQHDPATPGDYFDEANWSNGLPDSSDAFIINGGTAQIASSGFGPCFQYVGSHAGTSGHLEMTSGEAFIGNLYLGSLGTATMSHTGGYLTVGGSCLLGIMREGSGTYELSGDAVLKLLGSSCLNVGAHGYGLFRQAGGRVLLLSTGEVWIGGQSGDIGGRYELLAGDLRAHGIYVGYYGGPAVFRQEGGTCTTPEVIVGSRYEHVGGLLTVNNSFAVRLGGLLTLAGGEAVMAHLSVDAAEIRLVGGSTRVSGDLSVSGGGGYGGGVLRIVGNAATLLVDEYHQGAQGKLACEVTGDGLATLNVSASAFLGGEWEVIDSAAPEGRFDVMISEDGFTGTFDSVTLPGELWSWGIEDNRTLWLQHVPEPATLGLLALGALALLRRKRSPRITRITRIRRDRNIGS